MHLNAVDHKNLAVVIMRRDHYNTMTLVNECFGQVIERIAPVAGVLKCWCMNRIFTLQISEKRSKRALNLGTGNEFSVRSIQT